MALVCPKWGDTSLWGDGDLWCGISGSAQHIAWLEGREYALVTSWNLQSPDLRIWTFTISTSGVVTVTDGVGTASSVPVLPDPSDDAWTPSIANTGIITLTDGGSVTAKQASLIDGDSVQWYWSVPESDGISTWNTRSIVGGRLKDHHVSVQVVYNDGDSFVIDRITALANILSQLPDRFTASLDFVSHKRVSIQVQYAGGDEFVVDRIQLIASVKKHQPKG